MVRTFLKVHTRPRLAYALRCRGYWIKYQYTTSYLPIRSGAFPEGRSVVLAASCKQLAVYVCVCVMCVFVNVYADPAAGPSFCEDARVLLSRDAEARGLLRAGLSYQSHNQCARVMLWRQQASRLCTGWRHAVPCALPAFNRSSCADSQPSL